jgi:hypothetical protein
MNYLYNGVELPDINEVWTDKETQPCASICDTPKGETRLVTCSAFLRCYVDGEHSITYTKPTAQYLLKNGEWVRMATGSGTIENHVGIPCWVSHDIYNEDGTLYLAASDPIPVGSENRGFYQWNISKDIITIDGEENDDSIDWIVNIDDEFLLAATYLE